MVTDVDIVAHIVFSIASGLLAWKLFGSRSKRSLLIALFCAFLSGVLIDIDHFFDYFLLYGFRFDIYDFMRGEQFIVTQKNYVLFHGFEYAMLLGGSLFFIKKREWKMIVFSLLVSLLFHLFIDMAIYSIPVQRYFLIYRIIHHFDLVEMNQSLSIASF